MLRLALDHAGLVVWPHVTGPIWTWVHVRVLTGTIRSLLLTEMKVSLLLTEVQVRGGHVTAGRMSRVPIHVRGWAGNMTGGRSAFGLCRRSHVAGGWVVFPAEIVQFFLLVGRAGHDVCAGKVFVCRYLQR